MFRPFSKIRIAHDPIMVVPYRGFANAERFFLKGRVLEDEGISKGTNESRLRNLMDSYRRFESDEVAGAKLSIQIAGNEYLAETDKEGFFSLNLPWHSPPEPLENQWISGKVKLLESPAKGVHPVEACTAELLFPSKNASFGIISDIDDTVLQTHVTSRFKLKMMYATLFKASHQRLPMEGSPDLLRALERGHDRLRENPIFYVSDSPWNIYDLLARFMEVHLLPKGPILLRDYGTHMLKRGSNRPIHKIEAFRQIMGMYPDLPFVMLGDTASKDADYYLQMAEEFDGRVLAIYIRQTRDNENARRIAKLIEANSHIAAVRVNTAAEIWTDARTRGLVSNQ